MNRSARFMAVWGGAFILIGQFFQWVIGQPILPLANKEATIGFVATLLLSTTTAWLLSKPRSATK